MFCFLHSRERGLLVDFPFELCAYAACFWGGLFFLYVFILVLYVHRLQKFRLASMTDSRGVKWNMNPLAHSAKINSWGYHVKSCVCLSKEKLRTCVELLTYSSYHPLTFIIVFSNRVISNSAWKVKRKKLRRTTATPCKARGKIPTLYVLRLQRPHTGVHVFFSSPS